MNMHILIEYIAQLTRYDKNKTIAYTYLIGQYHVLDTQTKTDYHKYAH